MGSVEGQQRMADEIRRIAGRYIIQTPAFFFPLEPHSHLPGFQFLPHRVRAHIIKHANVNYFPSKETLEECLEVSKSTLMLTARRFHGLFPEAVLTREKMFGLTKSFTAIYGFSP